MKNILVLSVPHTGTIFVCNYLRYVLGLELQAPRGLMRGESGFARTHTVHSYVDEDPSGIDDWAVDNCNIVIPLRNPIDSAVSTIARDEDIDVCYANWEQLRATHQRYAAFWLDVNTSQTSRLNMMKQLNEFLGVSPLDSAVFTAFVDAWEKVNYTSADNPVTKAYVEQGILPSGYDYSIFDPAMVLYNSKRTS